MDELIKLIKAPLNERLSSPIISSFLIAWSAVNYKFILIILSNNSITATFELIKIYSFRDATDIWWKGIFWPILFAFIYIFFLPFIEKPIYVFRRSRQNILLEEKLKADKEQPYSKDEVRALILEQEEKNNKFKLILDQKDNAIRLLEKTLADQKTNDLIENKETKSKSQHVIVNSIGNSAVLKEEQLEFLYALSRSSNETLSEDSLITNKRNADERIIAKHIADKLLESGLIERKYNDRTSGYNLLLTPKGREVLIDSGKITKPNA